MTEHNEGDQHTHQPDEGLEQIQIRPEFLLPAEQEARQKAEGENVMLRALVAQLRADLSNQAKVIDGMAANQKVKAADKAAVKKPPKDRPGMVHGRGKAPKNPPAKSGDKK